MMENPMEIEINPIQSLQLNQNRAFSLDCVVYLAPLLEVSDMLVLEYTANPEIRLSSFFRREAPTI